MDFQTSDLCTEQNTRRNSAAFIVNFEHISHRFPVFLLLTWSKYLFAG